MEDDNSMSERILRTIESIVNSDPELKEFAVIPVETNTRNKSPVVYEEHNVGLESWCIKHIYRYAYLELFEVRKRLTKKTLSFCKEQNLNHLLIGVLLINPDVTTFWNMKRELVEMDILNVGQELLFARLVLSYKGKSNEAFAYRRWLLKRVLTKLDTLGELLQNEMSVCEMAALKNSNNYHAWTHRIWCMEHLLHRLPNFNEILRREQLFTFGWLYTHLSEHAGFHYRQYLINHSRRSKEVAVVKMSYALSIMKIFKLLDDCEPCDRLNRVLGKSQQQPPPHLFNFLILLVIDLNFTTEKINMHGPSHESEFYHRRYLLYHLMEVIHEHHGLSFGKDVKIDDDRVCGSNIVDVVSTELSDGEKKPKLFKSQPNNVQSSVLYQRLIEDERHFIDKELHFAFCEDRLVRRHVKWLELILGWRVDAYVPN